MRKYYTSMANKNNLVTKLKCLWAQQAKESLSQSISQAASLAWLFFSETLTSIIKHPRKYSDNTEIINKSQISIKFSENLVIILDKGYRSTQQYVWAIIPKKKHGKLFPIDNKSWNVTVANNSITFEIFLASHKTLGYYLVKIQAYGQNLWHSLLPLCSINKLSYFLPPSVWWWKCYPLHLLQIL